jgi:hypothetical protein
MSRPWRSAPVSCLPLPRCLTSTVKTRIGPWPPRRAWDFDVSKVAEPAAGDEGRGIGTDMTNCTSLDVGPRLCRMAGSARLTTLKSSIGSKAPISSAGSESALRITFHFKQSSCIGTHDLRSLIGTIRGAVLSSSKDFFALGASIGALLGGSFR